MNARAPEKEVLAIAGPTGRIEALLEAPRNSPGTRVGVVCHPHPLHQGTMMNKVVYTIARALNDLGMPAVRFNFRGVGASDGEYADGIGETDDVLAVVRWATETYPAAKVWLAGFSFGALVSYRAALGTDTDQLISIAPPVDRFKDLASEQPVCPWLIIQGDADDVVSCDEVVAWVNELQPGLELMVFPGAGHFFHGQLIQLRAALVDSLS
jgi:alpha/beta superfamily hydrolase